jgi:hypothetical protein
MTLVEPVSVAPKVGTVPETPLLLASFNVMVIVEVAVPSAMTGEVPEIEEFKATGVPGVKRTVPSAFTTGVAIERVFVSDLVEARVHVEIPEVSVEEQVPYVFPEPVSVAENVGTVPITGLLEASLRVTVTVDVAVPSATTGPVPVMLEFAATAAPAVKTTVPSAFATGVAIERVFVSAVDDFNVQVETPDESVEEHTP